MERGEEEDGVLGRRRLSVHMSLNPCRDDGDALA
jgi:hypothetical protein